MTQIQHVTEKEMIRRTGINALGYTYPEKDLILLKKGLTGKKKREVLDHEVNHLKNNEEGPFIDPGTAILGGAGLSAIGGLVGGSKQKDANQAMADAMMRINAMARKDIKPWRNFGYSQLSDMQNWLAGPGGSFSAPTTEEVLNSPGYDTRLTAIENSAAVGPGLRSGNALRSIGEFGADEYDRTYGRKMNQWQSELQKRLNLLNLGYGAAGGSAQITNSLAPMLATPYSGIANAQAGKYGDITNALAGGLGAYTGYNQWQDFLNKAYPGT